jgi:hypothetical protein
MALGLGVPDQQRLTQAGAGGDQATVPDGARVARLQRADALRSKLRDAVAVGLQIVDQEDVLDAERAAQIARIQRPGQVSQLQAAVAYWAGAAEAGGYDFFLLARVIAQERLDDGVELENSCAGNFWSRTGASRPPEKLYKARCTLVPPTSPARIMRPQSVESRG